MRYIGRPLLFTIAQLEIFPEVPHPSLLALGCDGWMSNAGEPCFCGKIDANDDVVVVSFAAPLSITRF